MLDLAILMLNHIQTRSFLEKVPIRRGCFGFGGHQSGDELSASKASHQVQQAPRQGGGPIRRGCFGFGGHQSGDELSASKASHQVYKVQ